MYPKGALLFRDREEWRRWLEANHDKETEVWFVRFKKHTGKECLGYDESVEEALCFGWIDGKIMRVDDEVFISRFSPRRRRSVWSDINKARARRMVRAGRMTEAGLEKIREAKRNGEW